ncbi:MAG: hypothetical protein RIB98_12400 [Acidimicrobiales bacterium]
MTSQIVEYAESGRLIEGTRLEVDDLRGTIALVVTAALLLGGGLSLAATGALGDGNTTVTLAAAMCALGALAILVPSIRLLRSGPVAPPVRVRPAAVLPPELVRVGNWIHRDGAWVRIEQIGKNGTDRVHALLSSGDLVELTTPVTIAGDDFRPTRDPVESLRP